MKLQILKGIPDMNRFAEIYQELLDKHNNPKAITGRDCFELSIDELGYL